MKKVEEEREKEMENRDYLRMYGEDCTEDIRCSDCDQKDICKKEIESEHDIVICD